MFKTFNEDRYFIERKFHNPDEEFNPYARMAYHGEGYDEKSGLDDKGILDGLDRLYPQIKDLPHPVAKATAIKYVLENERLYINEHDYFVGMYSLNRLAGTVTIQKWNHEVYNDIREYESVQLENDFNESGAVAMWPDYDHVIPDWDSIMTLGFKGLKDRAIKYKDERISNGTLTEDEKA